MRRTRRDADSPKEGDVFQSRSGNRWRVNRVAADGKRVFVKRAAHAKDSDEYQWSASTLKSMKLVGEPKGQLSFFGLGRDPSSRRRGDVRVDVRRFGGAYVVVVDGRRERSFSDARAAYAYAARAYGPDAVRSAVLRDRARRSDRSRSRSRSSTRKKRSAKTPRCRSAVVVQTLLFSRRIFTRRQAVAWAKRHGFRYASVDVTKNEYRLRQVAPSSVRTVGSRSMRGGVLAVYGCPKRTARKKGAK